MKITDIKIHVLRPIKGYRSSLGDLLLDHPAALLRVFTDQGIEGNFITGQKGFASEEMEFVFGRLKSLVIGEDPFNREKIYQDFFRSGGISGNFGVGLAPALSALDIALWDIAGKAFNTPIYKLLGAYKEKVRAYASTTMHSSVEDYVDFCRKLVERGYTAIKLHVWTEPKRDMQLLKAVRQAVGDDIDLMLDGSMAYNREWALKIGRELDRLGFNWYEDPLVNSDIHGYVELCRALDVPVKVCEGISAFSRAPPIRIIAEYIRRGAADIIGSLGDNVGGITAMQKIAAVCDMEGIRYEPHNWGTTHTQAAHFHIELASRNCEFFELTVPEGLKDIGTKDAFRIDKEGFVRAPTKPGLGVEIDWEKIKELTLRVF